MAIVFCPALPILLPFAALFMFLSYQIDRFNLLRVLKPPPHLRPRATHRDGARLARDVAACRLFALTIQAERRRELAVQRGR